jgi:hypothetical protein
MCSKPFLTFIGALLLAGCSPEMVAVSQMMSVPPRPDNCRLELVQADMMELSPMGAKWDVLGMVTIAKGNTNGLDPASEAVRSIIRPKACHLGGTSVALMTNTAASAPMGGSGGAITFAVLRPKQAPAAPTQF